MRPLLPLAALALALAACAPADGPRTGRIVAEARRDQIPILPLTVRTVTALGTPRPVSGFGGLGRAAYQPGVIKPGDTIEVTAFGAGETGLFDATTSAALPLGEFAVSQSGTVSLPFVGGIQVAGRTVNAAQETITTRLRETAVDPYATVSIVRKERDTYSVQGAVPDGGIYGLTARGESVLDGVATAGGAEGAPESTTVTLIRGGRRGTELLSRLVQDPSRNIPLLPGDTLVVGGGDATFTADGALGAPGAFPFQEGALTLAEAVSRAGGLQDARADPGAVFVLRNLRPGESFVVADREGAQRTILGAVIFGADFADPSERLLAGRFQMRDGDAIYVGNAPLANFGKLLQVFQRPPEPPALPGA